MKKHIFLLLCLILFGLKNYSQNRLDYVDSVHIAKADSIAGNLLGSKANNSSYLVLIINEKLLLVFKDDVSYHVFRGYYSFDIKNQRWEISKLETEIISENKILMRCFNQQICRPSFFYIGSDSKLIENAKWGPKYYYFMVKKSGIKQCEIILPITYSIKIDKPRSVPINHTVLKYLVTLMKLIPY